MTTLSDSTDSPGSADQHLTAGPPTVGDTSTFPSHADYARTLVAGSGTASLSTITRSGHPYTSLAPFSAGADGAPVICVSELAEHTQNLRYDRRASLLVTSPNPDEVDPLSLPRVTLVGEFNQIEADDDVIATHLRAHPHARGYVGLADFGWWQFSVLQARYVGGFGFMGWADAAGYEAAAPDPVIPHAAPMIEHLNDDHADACAEIARVLIGVEDTDRATVTDIDRYGMTLDLRDGSGALVAIGRVAFEPSLDSPDDVRSATVRLVHQARRAGKAD